MEFTLDLSSLYTFLYGRSPLEVAWIVFLRGGWIIIAYMILHLWWALRLLRLQGKFLSGIEYCLLAIDIPKDSEQTPKAMEQVFATITGAHQDISSRDKYFKGEVQISFSFEIISIDGYVQFLIRTPKVHRDLVEGAVYSQYPDAEITEVEDYVKDFPSHFPNDHYNLWGTEVELVRNEAFPIRTYKYFEDPLSQELKDPLASLIETMSRIQKNEQVWFQIVIVPTENTKWVQKALKQAYKICGKKAPEKKKTLFDMLLDWLYRLPDFLPFIASSSVYGEERREIFDFRVMNLTPGEREIVEAIEQKASKLGYICKLRLMYVSPHEQYQTSRVINSVYGALKQFGYLTRNSFRPNKRTKTSVVWFFVEQRKNMRRQRLMRNYKNRSWYMGSKYFILNIEELASLYHFPSITVKTPYLKRTEVKKSDSPAHLPTYDEVPVRDYEESLREQLVNLELNNDYYEQRYAKVKTPSAAAPRKNEQGSVRDNAPDNLPIVQ